MAEIDEKAAVEWAEKVLNAHSSRYSLAARNVARYVLLAARKAKP